MFAITVVVIIIIIMKHRSHQSHHSTVSCQLLCQPDSHFLTPVTQPFMCIRTHLVCLSPGRLISNECRLLIALLSRSVCKLYRAAHRCVSPCRPTHQYVPSVETCTTVCSACTELHIDVCSTQYRKCNRKCVRPKPNQRMLTICRPWSCMAVVGV